MSELSSILGDRLLVLFDGHCGLCNRSVRWFLKRDRLDRLRFAPSNAPQVTEVTRLKSAVSDADGPNSILVALHAGSPQQQLLARSDAVLAILARLPQPWPALAAIVRVVPRPLRDLAYRLVARSRYRLWGRLESCPIPTPVERAHFL